MPPVEPTSDEGKESAPAAKPVIGIIYPPPEVRSILHYHAIIRLSGYGSGVAIIGDVVLL